MTQSAIARFEAGGTVPTLPVLERLAHALDVELAVHFTPGRPPPDDPHDHQRAPACPSRARSHGKQRRGSDPLGQAAAMSTFSRRGRADAPAGICTHRG